MAYEYKPKTAQDAAAEVSGGQFDDKERAEKAGVVGAEYIDYEKALKNYESRSDVEPLAERRAREGGRAFDETAFRRQVGGSDAESGVTTSDEVSKPHAEQVASKGKR